MTGSEGFAERQIRAAESESVCRDENERTEEESDSSQFTAFTCECTHACEVLVSLTIDEYEEVRRVPTHFLAARAISSSASRSSYGRPRASRSSRRSAPAPRSLRVSIPVESRRRSETRRSTQRGSGG